VLNETSLHDCLLARNASEVRQRRTRKYVRQLGKGGDDVIRIDRMAKGAQESNGTPDS
jgi:hypothetical protein